MREKYEQDTGAWDSCIKIKQNQISNRQVIFDTPLLCRQAHWSRWPVHQVSEGVEQVPHRHREEQRSGKANPDTRVPDCDVGRDQVGI